MRVHTAREQESERAKEHEREKENENEPRKKRSVRIRKRDGTKNQQSNRMAKNFYVEKENSGENNADAKFKMKRHFCYTFEKPCIGIIQAILTLSTHFHFHISDKIKRLPVLKFFFGGVLETKITTTTNQIYFDNTVH